MTLMTAVVAAVIGGVVGWFIAAGRGKARLLARESEVQAELQRRVAEATLARAERARAEAEQAALRQRVEEALQNRATAEARLATAERMLGENRDFVEQSKKDLENSFAALATQTLKSVGEQLLQLGKTQFDGSKGEIVQSLDTKKAEIEALLTPLREMVDGYRTEVQKSEHVRNEVYGGLQEQIRQLLSVQESAQREASRLATALQSPTVRGSWGEVTLRRVVELAGMAEYCDFFAQETIWTDEGRRLRPDMIVRMPSSRVIAIDAKAPTSDYHAVAEAQDEESKRTLLSAHAKNLRRHIEALSRKEYQTALGDSLDFVIMFLPAEHLLSAALVTDPQLFEFGAERKVYLASPTVLLPLLRAVHAGWKAEKTEENARRMHDTSVELFNRFVVVMEHINSVGDQLRKTVESYNKAMRSIDTRLWPKGEELQRMAGSGRDLGEVKQLEAVPLESSRLRLTMQQEEPGDVVRIDGSGA